MVQLLRPVAGDCPAHLRGVASQISETLGTGVVVMEKLQGVGATSWDPVRLLMYL